jgi:xanthine dehydrogenase accessory factor
MRQLKLGSEGKAFVLVGVLRTEGPTAVKAGNKAIILADGSVDGWIGGHCTEDEIVSTARECLKDGATRFLNLTTCQGGRMDLYLEPYLPKRRLILFGHVPIVAALANLAESLNFAVTVVDSQATKEKFPQADQVLASFDLYDQGVSSDQTFAVVATMGEFDIDHVMGLCKLNLPYIGVVAGKKRSKEIYSYLKSKGVPREQLDRVKSPAGIYIRAVTAEEIALSIMAEIVEVARAQKMKDPLEFQRGIPIRHEGRESSEAEEKEETTSKQQQAPKASSQTITVDPVCGMTVESSSEFYSKTGGQIIYFCCEDCKRSFDADPQQYMLTKNN